ncbi:MAG: hypothetical protein LBB88_11975 [Planctomycetaceae bacterium]|jgi:hypothetical protein|nr:hypothetical protein [Planctomycetaceae bacterium]
MVFKSKDNFFGGHWGQRGRWGRSCLKSGINDSVGTKFEEKISLLKKVALPKATIKWIQQ